MLLSRSYYQCSKIQLEIALKINRKNGYNICRKPHRCFFSKKNNLAILWHNFIDTKSFFMSFDEEKFCQPTPYLSLSCSNIFSFPFFCSMCPYSYLQAAPLPPTSIICSCSIFAVHPPVSTTTGLVYLIEAMLSMGSISLGL